jgi:NAD(P)-dependent dehydrogenase (short-subunit alcohol dehydrogenase family)
MNKVLLVTGGSAGIGAATVRLAAARGYRVAFSYRQSADMARALEAEITRDGGTALGFQAEASDEAQTVSLFRSVDEVFGPITALVTNAGITGGTSTLEAMTVDRLDTTMDINIRGVFLATREAIKRMATDLGGPGGAIVNLSSVASTLGGPNDWVHYAASKGAINSMTIGAAKELAPRGIRVNAVLPGLIDTEIHAKAGLGDRLEKLGSSVPLGRVGTAHEVALAILWLLSEEAGYVTGALLPVSGGR